MWAFRCPTGITTSSLLRPRRSRFELNRHDNHHHYVCRTCGRIEDVPCPVGAPPCLEPDPALGFATEAADVTYKGQCRECRPAP
ncbi:transcriptional repressor [Blastococcus sp. Marseille-P5729]|uniref:Fur family transcriptional regulator n=1 Tax=Blastococcus sp. Marseille-P5729 TaxID=2086582 RepID=UPI000D112706